MIKAFVVCAYQVLIQLSLQQSAVFSSNERSDLAISLACGLISMVSTLKYAATILKSFISGWFNAKISNKLFVKSQFTSLACLFS